MDASARRAAAAKIEAYLAYLHDPETPKRTRSKEWTQNKVKALKAELKQPDITWVQKVLLLQRIIGYEAQLDNGFFEDLERDFVEALSVWSPDAGIDVEVWLELHVPRRLLKDAGLL